MLKSTMFKAAHQLTKSVIKAGDNYRVTFGAAIKTIVAMSKKYTMAFVSNAEKLAKILENKGKADYWYNGTQKGFNRYYLNFDVDTCFIDVKSGLVAVEGDSDFLNKIVSKIKLAVA